MIKKTIQYFAIPRKTSVRRVSTGDRGTEGGDSIGLQGHPPTLRPFDTSCNPPAHS